MADLWQTHSFTTNASSSNSTFVYNHTINFPDRPVCFQVDDGLIPHPECGPVSTTMLDFLNITDVQSYFDAYCLNPPDDSCSFGLCPNSDIAGPAVRYSTYVTSICLAIVVWYQPEDANDSFYAQILTVYSLVIAAIIGTANHNLTKLHALFAAVAASSPLSIYLFVYAVRAFFGEQTRLQSLFGPGKWVNRSIVLLIAPVWAMFIVFLAVPSETYHFQQAACELNGSSNFVEVLFFVPVVAVFLDTGKSALITLYVLLPVLPIVVWGFALIYLRHEVWNGSKKFPANRIWDVVMSRYPTLEFFIVIFLPHFYWVFYLEFGAFLTRESFDASYGQLLALFVAVPPLFSLLKLSPRLWRWFLGLTWMRFLRRKAGFGNAPYHDSEPLTGVGSRTPPSRHHTSRDHGEWGTDSPNSFGVVEPERGLWPGQGKRTFRHIPSHYAVLGSETFLEPAQLQDVQLRDEENI